jgi:hypothetical protein
VEAVKVCVWGGPWDGRVVDIARPGPIQVMKEPAPVHVWDDAGPIMSRLDMVTYDVKRFYAPYIARRAGEEGPWDILVPAGAGDEELQLLQERHCTPVVDGPRDPISFDDVFDAAVTEARHQVLAEALDAVLDEQWPREENWEWGPDTAHWSPS